MLASQHPLSHSRPRVPPPRYPPLLLPSFDGVGPRHSNTGHRFVSLQIAFDEQPRGDHSCPAKATLAMNENSPPVAQQAA